MIVEPAAGESAPGHASLSRLAPIASRRLSHKLRLEPSPHHRCCCCCAGLPIGVPSYLLVALANSGPKMFNVTKINGVVSDAVTGVPYANFTRKIYGDPLGPREQRSFRFPFVPKKSLSPAQYRLTFSAYYSNRDKEPFVSVVYNELHVLVAGPREPAFTMPDLGSIAVPLAVVLGAIVAYTNFAPAAGKSAPKDTTKPSEPTQWLPQNADVVGAASPGKKKKAAGKK